MPFVTASDGTELYYEVEGDGFPLVFTHGNMGFGQQFFLQHFIGSVAVLALQFLHLLCDGLLPILSEERIGDD